mmetsp:Transcript_50980/g.119159  ORF Transcript_50980/g.119159 Transcript_50980/m.119159 type:complete len:222 (-) Transcript_50980:461-1126(-)
MQPLRVKQHDFQAALQVQAHLPPVSPSLPSPVSSWLCSSLLALSSLFFPSFFWPLPPAEALQVLLPSVPGSSPPQPHLLAQTLARESSLVSGPQSAPLPSCPHWPVSQQHWSLLPPLSPLLPRPHPPRRPHLPLRHHLPPPLRNHLLHLHHHSHPLLRHLLPQRPLPPHHLPLQGPPAPHMAPRPLHLPLPPLLPHQPPDPGCLGLIFLASQDPRLSQLCP